MDWNSAWQTASAVIVSFGGAAIIIAGIVKWSADRIAEQIIKKKEFEFSQKLEALKSSLEKKNYISKVRFDIEIAVYRELSEAILPMALEITVVVPIAESFLQNGKPAKEITEKALTQIFDSYEKWVIAISRNAPFIPQKTYDLFMDTAQTCSKLAYLARKIFSTDTPPHEAVVRECRDRSEELTEKINTLMERLRQHIASLDVLDK